MIGIIARHEYRGLVQSAQTWVITALLALLFGFLFLRQLEAFLNVQDQLALQDYPVGLTGFMSAQYLQPLALAFSFVAPLFAMRTFSDEYQKHTYALWQSSPVSSTSLVLGKYLGLSLFVLLLVLLASGMLLLLQIFIPIDLPVVVTSAVGLSLCALASTACGVFFSSLTRHSLIAIIASFALIIVLWLLQSANFGNLPLQAIQNLSFANHLAGFFQGYLQAADVAYFVLLSAVFLALTIVRLDLLKQTGY